MWSAQDLAEARPNILVMASGQPEVCLCGATRSLGVVDPGNALEEHFLLPRLCSRNSCTYSIFQMGMPRTSPLLGSRKQRITSPNNGFRFQHSSPRSHWVQRHLCSTLGSNRCARGCERVWPIVPPPSCALRPTAPVDTRCKCHQERHHVFSGPHPWRALCCPKANNNGMRGSPCCAPLVLPQMCGWAPVETSHKGEDLISSLHPKKAFKHRVPGVQIARTYPIDRHDGRFWVQIGERLQDVSDALTSYFGGQGVLEGNCGCFDLLDDLLRDSPCHYLRKTSPKTTPRTPSPPPPSSLQCCHAPEPNCLQNGLWDLPHRQQTGDLAQQFGVTFSKTGKRWSDVMPEQPAPRRALVRQVRNSIESNSNVSTS